MKKWPLFLCLAGSGLGFSAAAQFQGQAYGQFNMGNNNPMGYYNPQQMQQQMYYPQAQQQQQMYQQQQANSVNGYTTTTNPGGAVPAANQQYVGEQPPVILTNGNVKVQDPCTTDRYANSGFSEKSSGGSPRSKQH